MGASQTWIWPWAPLRKKKNVQYINRRYEDCTLYIMCMDDEWPIWGTGHWFFFLYIFCYNNQTCPVPSKYNAKFTKITVKWTATLIQIYNKTQELSTTSFFFNRHYSKENHAWCYRKVCKPHLIILLPCKVINPPSIKTLYLDTKLTYQTCFCFLTPLKMSLKNGWKTISYFILSTFLIETWG